MSSADKAVVYRCTVCHAVYSAGERFCPRDAAPIAADDGTADPRIGRTIDGRYFVKRLLGKGGMGSVYEADHVGLDKRVAIKFLATTMTDRESLARFRREAKIASRIVHEHVVQIFDVGTADSDTDFIVMEFLDGRDLGAVLRDGGAIEPERALSIIRKVLRGLRAIHQAGIVHRDIKPANVLLASRDDDRDFVKIMDFGISKSVTGDTITHTGAIIGTPEYMAPEQLLADDIDQRADLYAVGLMMYKLIANRLPFITDVFDRASAASPFVPVPAIDTFVPGLPKPIVDVVAKAVAKERDERYADAAAFLAALESVTGASRVSTPAISPTATPVTRPPSALEAADTVVPVSGVEATAIAPTGGAASAAGAAATAVPLSSVAAGAPTVASTVTPAPARKLAWWMPVGGLAVVAAAVVAIIVMRGGNAKDDTPAKPVGTPIATPTPPAGKPIATPTPPTPPAPPTGSASPSSGDRRRRAREAERDGKLDDAIAAYLEAYTIDADADSAFHLAELYERTGKTPEAVTYFQRYLHQAPTAADRDAVMQRIARLEKAATKTGTTADAKPTKPLLACHCFSRDGRPDRQALCSRKGTSLCRCQKDTGVKLCPVAVELCESCDGGHSCPVATFDKHVKPGTHEAACTGFDIWSGEQSDGKLECDVCSTDPPRQFHGNNGDPCTGYYRHTGQTIAGVMDCD